MSGWPWVGGWLAPAVDTEKQRAKDNLQEKVASLIEKVAEASPLVQCITNYVSMDFMANTLLAIGASPAMVAPALQLSTSKSCAPNDLQARPSLLGIQVHSKEEVEDFVKIASALLVNVGTLSPAWVESMQLAASAAHKLGEALGAGSCRCWRNALQNSGLLLGTSISSATLECWLALRGIMLSLADNSIPGEAEAHRDPGERL